MAAPVGARNAHRLGIAINECCSRPRPLDRPYVPLLGTFQLRRNFVLPSIWLGLSVPFFYWRYREVLALLMHEAGSANAEKYNHAEWMLALGNAVPFVGPLTIDSEIKKFLFCPAALLVACRPFRRKGFNSW